MKKFLIIGLLVGTIVTVAGCSSQTPAPTPAPAPAPQVQTPSSQNTTSSNQIPAPTTSTQTTAASGKDVYDKKCAGCHGAGGAGGPSPALNTEKRAQAEVIDVTKKGKGSMPGFSSTLSDAEIKAVSQYVVDLKK